MCGSYIDLEALFNKNAKVPAVKGYDVHIYFDMLSCGILKSPEREKKANALAKSLLEIIPQAEGPFQVPAGAGPHLLANVEVTIPPESLSKALTFLQLNNPGLSILVHPRTGDEIKDHTELANWIGTPVPLKLGMLEPVQPKKGVQKPKPPKAA